MSTHSSPPSSLEKDPEKVETPVESVEGRNYALAYPDVDEKSLVRKLDRHLIPGVTILYLLSFLDRANVGVSSALDSPQTATDIV